MVVTVEPKLEALQRLDKGETIQQGAEEFGVCCLAFDDWSRTTSRLEKWCYARAFHGGLKERKNE